LAGILPTPFGGAPQFGNKWYLEEVIVTINGKKHWLWRAVDLDGFVLDALAVTGGLPNDYCASSSANKPAPRGC